MEHTVTEVEPSLARKLNRKRPHVRLCWASASGPREVALQGRLVIGSAPQAGAVLEDRRVSRLHAELQVTDDGVWVRDLGSSNGTWLGPVQVDRACVRETTTLRLGPLEATLRFDPASDNVPLWPEERLGPLLGGSEPMRELFVQLAQAAASDATVLLTGESGTGKELLAQQLHKLSRRAAGPFVVVDCGALPEALLESELFGYVKGAFTGALHDRAGAFEEATGGTVFLDEVGELPLPLQPRLLRALESKTVRRLGQHQHREVDVRFVAATNRDLPSMVSQGTFREDLYFRLSVLPLFAPPLRARPGDLDQLLAAFVAGRATVTSALVAELRSWPWPGNVRELKSFAERFVTLGAERALALLRGTASVAPATVSDTGAPEVDLTVPFKDLRERWVSTLERRYFEQLFARDGRDVSKAADHAGLDRSYVHRILRKHGL